MCTRFIKYLLSFYTELRIVPLVATYASWINFLIFRNKFFMWMMQKCVFLQMAWPCTHSGFTHNNVTVLYLLTCSSRGGLELGVYSMSVFRISGGLLHYIWIYACALIPKRKTIFSFNFFFLLACLNWFENNHWNTSVYHLWEVNIQLVLLFFFFSLLEKFVYVDRPPWQIPPNCADVVDAFEASLLCSAGVPAECCHLALQAGFCGQRT